MRQNSIDYPGERAPRRPRTIAQAGYTGGNCCAVVYRNQSVTVHAADELAAIFTAAKYWGYKWSVPFPSMVVVFHQQAEVA